MAGLESEEQEERMRDNNQGLRNRLKSEQEQACVCGHYNVLHDGERCNSYRCPCQLFHVKESGLLWDEPAAPPWDSYDERPAEAFEEWFLEREERENERALRAEGGTL